MGFNRALVLTLCAGVGVRAFEPATLSQLDYSCSALWKMTEDSTFDVSPSSVQFDHVPDAYTTLEVHASSGQTETRIIHVATVATLGALIVDGDEEAGGWDVVFDGDGEITFVDEESNCNNPTFIPTPNPTAQPTPEPTSQPTPLPTIMPTPSTVFKNQIQFITSGTTAASALTMTNARAGLLGRLLGADANDPHVLFNFHISTLPVARRRLDGADNSEEVDFVEAHANPRELATPGVFSVEIRVDIAALGFETPAEWTAAQSSALNAAKSAINAAWAASCGCTFTVSSFLIFNDPTWPTFYPSKQPVPLPTKVPFPVPSFAPTASFAPTNGTPKPTRRPTAHPTGHPTPRPIPAPSRNPTKHPVFAPTLRPTKHPVPHPTKEPSVTLAPTHDPTKAATVVVVTNVVTTGSTDDGAGASAASSSLLLGVAAVALLVVGLVAVTTCRRKKAAPDNGALAVIDSLVNDDAKLVMERQASTLEMGAVGAAEAAVDEEDTGLMEFFREAGFKASRAKELSAKFSARGYDGIADIAGMDDAEMSDSVMAELSMMAPEIRKFRGAVTKLREAAAAAGSRGAGDVEMGTVKPAAAFVPTSPHDAECLAFLKTAALEEYFPRIMAEAGGNITIEEMCNPDFISDQMLLKMKLNKVEIRRFRRAVDENAKANATARTTTGGGRGAASQDQSQDQADADAKAKASDKTFGAVEADNKMDTAGIIDLDADVAKVESKLDARRRKRAEEAMAKEAAAMDKGAPRDQFADTNLDGDDPTGTRI